MKWIIPDALDYMGVKADDKKIFSQPFVYTYYNENNEAIYVGKTVRLYDRIDNHSRQKWYKEAKSIGLIMADNVQDMDLIEVIEIHKKKPLYNKDCNKDYSSKYVWIKGANFNLIEIKENYEEILFDVKEIENKFYNNN